MKKNGLNLYLLYHFKDSNDLSLELSESAYHVVILFSETGELGVNECKKVVPGLIDMKDLTFRTKDEVMNFAKSCLQELDYAKIYLLASSDFNIGIESCHDLSSFREIFDRYGHELVLDPSEAGSKSLFGKLF